MAEDWNRYVLAWLTAGVPIVRYEEFLADPVIAAQSLLSFAGLNVPDPAIIRALEAKTKEKLHEALSEAFVHNTFCAQRCSGRLAQPFSRAPHGRI